MLRDIAFREGEFRGAPLGNIAERAAKYEHSNDLPRHHVSKIASDYLNRALISTAPDDVREHPGEWEVVHELLAQKNKEENFSNRKFSGKRKDILSALHFLQFSSSSFVGYEIETQRRSVWWNGLFSFRSRQLQVGVHVGSAGGLVLNSNLRLLDCSNIEQGHILLESAFLQIGTPPIISLEELKTELTKRQDWINAVVSFVTRT
ncbi:hypothetical protein ACN2XU_07070 [Primorskyibacter sp. 2E107]